MLDAGAAVHLFDARSHSIVVLPPPDRGPIVLALKHASADSLPLNQHRTVTMADTLRRLLEWKGYDVETVPRVDVKSVIEVCGPDDLLCKLLVAPVKVRRVMLISEFRRWGPCRPGTLQDLTEHGLTDADVRLGWLMAGHYRQVRRFWACSPLGYLDDARVTRRRMVRRAGRLDPLPAVPTEAAAVRLLRPYTPGFRALANVDAALSTDLHTPRAIAALHLALRTPELTAHDRRVLLSAAHRLLGLPLETG